MGSQGMLPPPKEEGAREGGWCHLVLSWAAAGRTDGRTQTEGGRETEALPFLVPSSYGENSRHRRRRRGRHLLLYPPL